VVIFAGQNPDDVQARRLGPPKTIMFDGRAITSTPLVSTMNSSNTRRARATV
jgi:hypothetical protein